MEQMMEKTLNVICKCGHVYTLHMHTVCPRCYRWPSKEEVSRVFKPEVPS